MGTGNGRADGSRVGSLSKALAHEAKKVLQKRQAGKGACWRKGLLFNNGCSAPSLPSDHSGSLFYFYVEQSPARMVELLQGFFRLEGSGRFPKCTLTLQPIPSPREAVRLVLADKEQQQTASY